MQIGIMRLIWAVFSTMLEEAAIAVIVLVALPELGILIPLPALIIIMVVWAAAAVFLYHAGTRALMRKPVIEIPVVGSKGKVVCPFVPEGMVRIKNELWIARARDAEVNVGDEVIVEAQDGLKLVVHPSQSEKKG